MAEFNLHFWGVRGTLPVPGENTVRYGGNTTCLEIRADDDLIIIDCGSGAYPLGKKLLAEDKLDADLLFTHTHLDHVCGLPFFKPAYRCDAEIRCWAGHLANGHGLEHVFSWLMAPALFPVPMDNLKGCKLLSFAPGDALTLGAGVTVRTLMLNHPGGAVGYRIEYAGKSLCIVFDHEHGDTAIDAALIPFVADADVMLYDANYTVEEYETYRGWGHSTWREGVALAEKAGVKHPIMVHHSTHRSDSDMDALAAHVSERFPHVSFAVEGTTIDLTAL